MESLHANIFLKLGSQMAQNYEKTKEMKKKKTEPHFKSVLQNRLIINLNKKAV